MAVLSDVQRTRVWCGLMRYWSQLKEALGAFSKSELRDAVNAADTWIDNNQANYRLFGEVS